MKIKCMLDTCSINRMMDKKIPLSDFINIEFYVTDKQEIELKNTKDNQRRMELLNFYNSCNCIITDRSSAEWGDPWGSSWNDAKHCEIRNKLKNKKSRVNDTHIIETALKNDMVLVSDDKEARQVMDEMKGSAITIEELRWKLNVT